MQRRRLILGILVVVAVVAAGVTFVRSRAAVSRRVEEFSSSTARFREAAARIPASLSATDPAVERHLVAACEAAEGVPLGDDERAELASTVGEFLARRFGGSSGAEYAAWMREQGFTLLSAEELEASWHIGDAFQIYGAEKPEGVEDGEQLWLAAWTAAERAPDHTMSIRKLPEKQDGYSVAIGRVTLANPVWPQPSDVVYQSMVHSGAVHTSRSWWQHPRGWQEQLQSQGEAIVAHVSFMSETAGGKRGTVCLAYVLDPTRKIWLLQSVSSDMPLRLEY